MTPLLLNDQQRLVLSYSPHLTRLLDALNPRGELRVLELKPDRSTIEVLQIECRLRGLEPHEALVWTQLRSEAPMLRVNGATSRLRAGTLWFGKVRFTGLMDAYVRLELPFTSLEQPSEQESWIVLTGHADPVALDSWAKDERERLAEESVTQSLEPILLQSEAFGCEALALGLRAAMLKLPASNASALLACTVPVLLTAWVRAWRESIAARAPGLRRVEAELVVDTEDSVRALIFQMDRRQQVPAVNRMQLFGSRGEPFWIWREQREAPWEVAEEDVNRLRDLTGASFVSVEEATSFLRELGALLLLHFQAHGTTQIEWPRKSLHRG